MLPKLSARGLLDLLFLRHNHFLAQRIGGEVARQCHANLWHCGRSRLERMSAAAIRGYVSAYASNYIGPKADVLLLRRGVDPSLRAAVVHAAIDQLVGMVIRDVLSIVPPAEAQPLAA
jgi:hypothetical protein